MKNQADRIIEQLKPILSASFESVLIMDEQYNLLWKNAPQCLDFPDNLKSVIKNSSQVDSDKLAGNKITVSIADKIMPGILARLEDFFILVVFDLDQKSKNNIFPAANDSRATGETNEIDIVYTSAAMKKTMDLAKRSSDIDATILLSGETGVGKTILAKYIHNLSSRMKAPFVSINCGAIPFPLLEAELFGYERGAFTGADREGKIGLFEAAMGGTVFLDEIGEISKDIQVKLLNAIDMREIIRVGGRKPIRLDIRLIAATNKDLVKMVKVGDFREDLYYRLNVISFTIPPLRNRREDILELARHYLRANNKKYNLNKQFDFGTLELMKEYNWPGNVRELQNSVERMLVMSENDLITESDLPPNILSFFSDAVFQGFDPERGRLQNETENLERELIQEALSECKSIRKAAIKLGISHVTLLRKMDRLNISTASKHGLQEVKSGNVQ